MLHLYKWGRRGIIKCRDREQIKSAMANKGHSVFFCLFALACFTVHANAAAPSRLVPFNRSSFPADFVFGAGSASYQSEGAALIDGRGPSIWDTYVRKHPEKIWDRSTGDIADDFYHRYKEDIKLMKKIGLDSFRFSISWSRLLPKGNIAGGVNPLGLKFYNNVINELLLNGIKPFVTLFHYDVPQALDDKYGGFLSPEIVDDFRDYADLCFKSFGDRVKDWVTMNEPNGFAINGYNGGTFAPGRCSNTVGNCTAGDSATEPYLVTHHLLLSHAAAVQLYREKYQSTQKGQIGITIVTHWFIPKFNTPTGRLAASRAFDFFFGWYANPITFGDYPKAMRATVGNRLPKFTPEQSKMLRGSYDFLGLNYYTVKYADFMTVPSGAKPSFYVDMRINLDNEKNKRILGTPTSLNWLFIYPKGLEETLQCIKTTYNNPPVILTENGLADNGSLPLDVARKDGLRIRYHSSHLSYLLKAIRDGVNVKAYYMWSFWDDFEWDAGYTVRFGMVYVDFKNNAKRYLKYSAYWFKMFLQK